MYHFETSRQSMKLHEVICAKSVTFTLTVLERTYHHHHHNIYIFLFLYLDPTKAIKFHDRFSICVQHGNDE